MARKSKYSGRKPTHDDAIKEINKLDYMCMKISVNPTDNSYNNLCMQKYRLFTMITGVDPKDDEKLRLET